MARSGIPALSGWNVYAGGTAVFDARNNYDVYTDGGWTQPGGAQYSINALPGKRTGYRLSVYPGERSGHQDLGRFHSPSKAVSAARAYYNKHRSNPVSAIPLKWTPAKVRVNAKGQVQVALGRKHVAR